MTGYASASREFPFGALSIELRAVNHRYLDIQFRVPDDLRAVEPTLREQLNENIGRGKVECRVSLITVPGAHKALKLNEDLLQQLGALEHRVRARIAGVVAGSSVVREVAAAVESGMAESRWASREAPADLSRESGRAKRERQRHPQPFPLRGYRLYRRGGAGTTARTALPVSTRPKIRRRRTARGR